MHGAYVGNVERFFTKWHKCGRVVVWCLPKMACWKKFTLMGALDVARREAFIRATLWAYWSSRWPRATLTVVFTDLADYTASVGRADREAFRS